MKYQGSKARHASEIIRCMAPYIKKSVRYIEPFVGGANVIDKVVHPSRFGYDMDPLLITLWRAVARGWMPPKRFTEAQYKEIRNAEDSPLKGYAAFALSYGGRRFQGWRRDSAGRRDYVAEAYRSAVRQFPLLAAVRFRCRDYRCIKIPPCSIVYCDPPYAGTKPYLLNTFDSEKFFQWCRYVSSHSKIFVSEYSAPSDFKCVWEKSVASSLTADTGGKRAVERLFTL